jgi:hypothetical protein
VPAPKILTDFVRRFIPNDQQTANDCVPLRCTARGWCMKVLIEKVRTMPVPTDFSNKINEETVAACQRGSALNALIFRFFGHRASPFASLERGLLSIKYNRDSLSHPSYFSRFYGVAVSAPPLKENKYHIMILSARKRENGNLRSRRRTVKGASFYRRERERERERKGSRSESGGS